MTFVSYLDYNKKDYRSVRTKIKKNEAGDTVKNMLKVMLAIIFVSSTFLFGCDKKDNELYNMLDTDKAEKTALEYMNEKYDKSFSVVRSQKNYDAGYVPT